MRIPRSGSMLALLLCLATGAAQAHGLWVAQRAGQWAAVYGEGAEDDVYDPSAIGQVDAWDGAGRPAPWRSERRAGQWLFLPEAPAAQVALRLDAGEWSETADGRWLPGGRGAPIADVRQTWRLQRYASALLAPTAEPLPPRGLPLEIVPLRAVHGLRRGDRLPVRVLLHGRPLAGAKVVADFVNDDQGEAQRTDADGVAVVTLGSNGLNVVQAGHAEACRGDCAVDRIAHSTTLSFTLPRRPE